MFTGPIFDSPEIEHIGPGQVAVPTHFYKAILTIEGDAKHMYAVIVPNAEQVNGTLNDYVATVDEVELRTGLDFFPSWTTPRRSNWSRKGNGSRKASASLHPHQLAPISVLNRFGP